MTLGENIALLRVQHHLSQGDLAEKLNVSRQSVSKWETNTSIPELDKLIALSDLFHISIDDLVRGRKIQDSVQHIPPSTPTASASIPANRPPFRSPQKRVGYLLLGIGLFCGIIGFLFHVYLFLMSPYLLMCAGFCILLKRNAGLVIGWMTFLIFVILGRYPFDYSDYSVIKYAALCLLLLRTHRIFIQWKREKAPSAPT